MHILVIASFTCNRVTITKIELLVMSKTRVTTLQSNYCDVGNIPPYKSFNPALLPLQLLVKICWRLLGS